VGGAGAGGYGAVLSDRRFAPWLALHAVFALVFLQFLAAGSIDMARHGLSPSAIGMALAVNCALIVSLQPWATTRLARLAPERVLAGAAVLLGLGYGGYALCATAWQYALATAVWSLGEIAYMPVAATRVADLAPAGLRGRYQGAYALSWGVAGFAAPAIGPSLLERFGPVALWGGCLAVAAGVALGQLAVARAARQPGEPAAEGTAAARAITKETCP